jgi:polyferredoxin
MKTFLQWLDDLHKWRFRRDEARSPKRIDWLTGLGFAVLIMLLMFEMTALAVYLYPELHATPQYWAMLGCSAALLILWFVTDLWVRHVRQELFGPDCD